MVLSEFKSLPDLMEAFSDPQSAIDYFTAIRWRHGEFCPYCQHGKIWRVNDRPNRFLCAGCKRKFTITVGTIFENTKLPLKTWFGAIWLITNHKKGIASTTLATDLGITQKAAWFVLHRLRYATALNSFKAPLTGVVEIDESFIGGKGKNKRGGRSGGGSGHSGKAKVVGAVERGGKVAARVLESVSKDNIQAFVRETVSTDATIVTDMNVAYRSLDDYPNKQVHYSSIRTSKVHSNTIENFWAMLKRQINGTHHWVSPKHLDKYVAEMAWRFNRRDMSAPERIGDLSSGVTGRLRYKDLIA